jgi:hypothetical protein
VTTWAAVTAGTGAGAGLTGARVPGLVAGGTTPGLVPVRRGPTTGKFDTREPTTGTFDMVLPSPRRPAGFGWAWAGVAGI